MAAEEAIRKGSGNRLLTALPREIWRAVEPHLELRELAAKEVLFEAGQALSHTFFPLSGTLVSVHVVMRQGDPVEAATIGCEGVVGGITTASSHPAFARAVAQVGGRAAQIPNHQLHKVKVASVALRDLFDRYADVLLAQVLQSVVCNAHHPMERRLARWLLATQDRIASNELPLTQENLAHMLGVHRSTVIRVARPLRELGVIRYARGRITIIDRIKLETMSCECYGSVSRHYDMVLFKAFERRRAGSGKGKRGIDGDG